MNARQIETALTALMYARFNHEDYWKTWAGGERPSTQLELIDESVKGLETLRAQLQPAPEGVTREQLAEYAHEAWSGWMKYLFSKGEFVPWTNPDGTIETRWVMPQWAVDRWARQANTPYSDLPDKEKESDREEADKMLEIVAQRPPASQPQG